jgi:hypothetical protein
MRALNLRRTGAFFALLGLVGCSSAHDDNAYGSEPPGSGDNDGGLSLGDGDGDSAPGATGGTTSLPEEVEDEESYRAPVATGRYLWSANPESGRVALIDVVDLSVQVLSAGLFPTARRSLRTKWPHM